MFHDDLSRRRFLRTGSGLLVAATLGGCVSNRGSDERAGTPGSTTTTTGPPDTNLSSTDTTTTAAAVPRPAPPGAARFAAVRPTRLADTGRAGGWTRIGPDRVRVVVAGNSGVPASATAAALCVTGRRGSVGAAVAVLPAADGEERMPSMVGIGPASRAMSFVMLVDGAVDVLHDTHAAVTVDLLGYFEPARTETPGGRLITIEPATVEDTIAAARPFDPTETRRITPGDACPSSARAVVVQLTVRGERAEGAWTVHAPDGSDGPPTFAAGPRGPTTGTTVVPLTGGGFAVTSEAGGHATIEVVGYVTGAEAPASTEGLYVPTTPTRLLDTRFARQPIPAGSSRELSIEPGCRAVAVTLTTVAAGAAGAALAWGAGRRPSTALSLAHGDTGATSMHALVRTGRRGIAVGTSASAAHVVADMYGWFVGAPSDERVPVLGSQPYGIQEVDMESSAAEWLDYGTSTDGRPLRAFRHGSGDRIGLLSTGLHGDEHTGTSVLADLVTHEPVPGWTLWLVPITNPDARAANLRFVRDVDMNRDFPVDWSELPTPTPSGCVTTRTGPVPHSLVESRLLAEAMTSGPFQGATISISHHDNYNWVAPQSGSPGVLRELADAYADATGLRRPGEGGSTVPTSPRATHVNGGFETFADSLGMTSILVENKAGYDGAGFCAGEFGVQPSPADVAPHRDALRALLTDGRLPVG